MQKNHLLLAVTAMALAGCGSNPFSCPPPMPAPAPAPAPKPAPQKPAPIAPVERTVLISKPITITGINFTVNSAKLLGRDIKVLDQVADFAKQHPTSHLNINGYCSKTGSYAYNYRLSVERAQSVARYLERHSVPATRMTVKGHSYRDPIASNATPQGRFMNQRVEIDSTVQERETVKQK
ncbi:OmpA family protein [Acidithiobacillus sp.]|uniref:OmpA family protein n=1 Tax=Acidithiobacillus sp. TaxID=1872118 RepID=UPI003CFBFEB6